ncbi:hypothetical protein HDU86_000920 [Geranomyces michiganensis]|nr:hypothetical protein HDU86_000920 [Geranomyces michiganensis]
MSNLVFGAALFNGDTSFSNGQPIPDLIQSFFTTFTELGIDTIDTAVIYGQSEELLGNAQVTKKFKVDTKLPGGFGPNESTRDVVVKTAKESLARLKTSQVDVYYIHSPDRRVDLKETLAGINDLHQQGAFKRFGISNFLPAEVEQVVRVAKENGFVLPSVYQGNYNAVSRHSEKELLPILRKHNIAYYVYSPIAGGFLTKSVRDITEGGTGRWDPNSMFGKFYRAIYEKPLLLKGLQLWEDLSVSTGIPKAELAYRWVAHNSKVDQSKGDKLIVGARTTEQLRQTVEGLKKGPLDAATVKKIDELWEVVKDESALDNFNK